MNILKTNELSFYNDYGILTLNAKQFNTGRVFVFNIMDNDEPFDLSGCTASLRIQKADGKQFLGKECCTIDGSKVTVNTSVGNGDQILTAAGTNECELHLEDPNGLTLTTWAFNINVQKRVHNGENISSLDSFDIIDNMANLEKGRIEGEKQREQNEKGRIESENKRTAKFNDAITETNAAITNCNLVIKKAEGEIDNFDKNINDIVDGITDEAKTYAAAASICAFNAEGCAASAKASAATASVCAYSAKESEKAAEEAKTAAQASEAKSGESKNTAAGSAATASICAYNAKESADAAAKYGESALDSKDKAAASEASADKYAGLSKSYAVGTGNAVRPDDSEDNAEAYAKKSQSYAVGGTGTRMGEDTDNSRYYSIQSGEYMNRAKEYSEIAGGLKIQPGAELADATVTFTEADARENIESGETAKVLFGKIKKWLSGLKPPAFNGTTSEKDVSEAGQYALDATENNPGIGNSLRSRIEKMNGAFMKTSDYPDADAFAEALDAYILSGGNATKNRTLYIYDDPNIFFPVAGNYGCHVAFNDGYWTMVAVNHWNPNIVYSLNKGLGTAVSGLISSGNIGEQSVKNADTVDTFHAAAFDQRFHFSTTNTKSTGYYKIKILKADSWMMSFILNIYQGYKSYSILVSGYNYGNNHWHNPKAVMLGSSEDSITIYFGYDSAFNLWVAFPAGDYTGLSITDIADSYRPQPNWSGLFSVVYEPSLSGTLQVAATAYRPYYKNDVNVVTTAKVLTTKEQIDANTDAGNVAGATAVKALKSDLADSISQVSGKLSDTGWIVLNNSYPTRYRRKNGFVTVTSAVNSKAISGEVVIGTLPVGCRPPWEMSAIDAVEGGTRISVLADGTVRMTYVPTVSKHDYCYATVTYPV